ncbi:MAG: NAD(P)/FAD-dependent oxidoreductase [Clostridia bacterium]|nr:NAD(P)/FAD-dependent oxidoreductase [Clostridia bacterium]
MLSEKTAIIIGAGPAGLTAAYELLKNTDIIPLVLEESDFIGGISRTAQHNGNRMDIGGHRFFSKNEKVNRLWQELMPLQGAPSFDDIRTQTHKDLNPNGPDPEIDEKVLLLRNRVSRIYYLRKFFDYPISLKPETFINMGFSRTFKAGMGYLKSCVSKKEETSLENFYINRFGRPLYEMFFEDYTEKLWGINPSHIAADWGAQRVKGLSLTKAVINVLTKPFKKKENTETSLIEQFYYPKKGPGQLWETLADEVEKMGGKILKNNRVTTLTVEGKKIKYVGVETPEGYTQYKADYFISTMPVKDLINGMGDDVPNTVREIALDLPYRDFITVGVLADRLLLENKTKHRTLGNIVPDCWIYIQERDVKLGRLQIFNNWSPYMVKDPENTVWIGLEYFCNEGDEYWNMSDSEFIDFAVDELQKIGIIDKADVKDCVRIKVKKAYPAYFGSYNEFSKVREYLDSIDNLYCIGRNGMHRYNNMDHSMLTAIEAVNCITNPNHNKSRIWDVNTEQEYHEEK